MQLDNQRIFSKKIKVPELLKDKLQLMTNCDLSVHEIDLFNVSLSCIEKQIQIDNINLNDFCKINVVFTKDGSFSFHENHEFRSGMQLYLATYRMNKIREQNADWYTLFVYVEELTHYFWRIYNEDEVKYKVVEILHDIFPKLTVEKMKENNIKWE